MANCDESSEVCEPPASCHGQAQTIRRGVPDPDITLPEIAVPTVAVWLASFTVWAAATFTVLSQPSRWWWVASIPIQGFVTFSMFTVLHESIHGAVGRRAFVNQLYGRLSMPFVSIFGTFPMLKYVHIEHHRNTNEDIHVDPDAWSLAGPGWLAPLRWLTIDAWYCHFYLSRLRRRPRGEIAGFLTNLVVVIALLCVVCALGGELKLVVIYFIPQRIGMLILAWWFDWLPHHDLGATAKVNRFRTTRLRVGWEPVMTPLLFYQNYHLVHHIHPMIPFYRYVRAWKNTQNDYLDRNVPISTAWGRELTPSEYRAWRGIDSLNDVLAASDQPARNRFHSLRVADVRRLTANSVSITFNVPSNLAALYRFEPGQNVVVRVTIDGQILRRNYSICTAAGSGFLRIAVKEVVGGRFSLYANTILAQGDELEVMPPSGRFTLAPARANGRYIGAIAAGSGITPVISILVSALIAEPHTRATLLYADHDRSSVMFGAELTMLARQFEGRLRITYFLSCCAGADVVVGSATGEPTYERIEAGRLTADRLDYLMERGHGDLLGAHEWYICAPEALATVVIRTLTNHHVPATQIHCEQFAPTHRVLCDTDAEVVTSTVMVTFDETTTRTTAAGDESLLEAALRAGIDVPYSCVGGSCGTCRTKLLAGSVRMEHNYALDETDLAEGWILACQSRPATDVVQVDFDNGARRSVERPGFDVQPRANRLWSMAFRRLRRRSIPRDGYGVGSS